MSTLDKQKLGRTVRMYVVLAAFCGVFGFAYEQFSHGVFSPFMGCLFLFPLLGGAVPFLVLYRLPDTRPPSTASRYAYYSGLAALTVGSCLTGVFDIYGTAAPLVGVYWVAGAALAAVGILMYLLALRAR